MRTKWFVLLVAAFTALTLWGCGSNGGSGGDSTSGAPEFGTDPDGNAYVGAGECVDCHQGLSFSQEAVADYLESKHVIHSSHINAGSDASCLVCHDPMATAELLSPSLTLRMCPRRAWPPSVAKSVMVVVANISVLDQCLT